MSQDTSGYRRGVSEEHYRYFRILPLDSNDIDTRSEMVVIEDWSMLYVIEFSLQYYLVDCLIARPSIVVCQTTRHRLEKYLIPHLVNPLKWSTAARV